jgi:glycosyltransferase involved in cell wall biosynthesis
MKVAVVHDWLVTYAGAERVLEEILHVFPQADLFAVVDFLGEEDRFFVQHKPVRTTFIQNLPRARKNYRTYLPLMPLAIEQHDLSDYDLVISSSHAVAKGVITGPDQLHIAYVHSPIRYAWDLQHQYLRESGLNRGVKRGMASILLHYMRLWDTRTANGVDAFVANSEFIARRINKVYGRSADVIYPPVRVDEFTLSEKKEDFFLTASRMVPYKRIDLIVEAFSGMPEKKLVVIGDGPDFEKIKKKSGSNVTLLGYQPFKVMKEYMQRAKAFVFAAEEDFGIIPVEAQACGTPVIAFGKGGSLETVQGLAAEEPTGIFFLKQEVGGLKEAVRSFEEKIHLFSPSACRKNALRFSNERFCREFAKYVETKAYNFF